jgi:alpha-1,2-mannosyltransferase
MTSATADPAAPEEGRRLGVALVVVAVVVALLAARQFSGDDLQVYRAAGRALLDGIDPYRGQLPGTWIPFSYTPFSTAVFVPLALLAKPVGMFVLTLGSLACLWFAVGRIVEEVRPSLGADRRRRTTAVVCAVLLLAEPITETLGLGQMNTFLLAMVVGDVLRRRPSRWQGAWIGLATAFKLTPGIFALYLLVTRRFRAAATAAAAFAATVVVGFAVMPHGSVTYWLHGVGADPQHVGQVNYIPNQSVLGSLSRIVGYDTARPWWLALCVPIAVGGTWLAVEVHRRWGDLAGLATIAFVAILVSPYSWSHHFLWFVVPALLVAHRGWTTRSWRLVVAAALWSVPFFVGPFWFVPERAWHRDHHPLGQALLGSTYTIVTLVGLGCVAWTVVAARGRERAAASGAGHGDVADDQAGEVVAAR